MNNSTNQCIHLHIHSGYSLYESTVHLHRYVEEATHRGLKHLAVTDGGNMFAVLEFYRLCQEAGINPIIGCEFVLSSSSVPSERVSERGTILLIAENNQGYQNLMQLSTHYHLDNDEPLLNDTLLREYHDGLIALTAGMDGEVSRLLLHGRYDKAEERALELQEIFGKDSLFLELQDDGTEESKIVNEGLAGLSNHLGIPLVAANTVHYLYREEAQACQVLQKIGSLYQKGVKYSLEGQSNQQYLKSEDDMHALFSEFPEAIENTLRIAQRCNIDLPIRAPDLPKLDIPGEYTTSHEYLRALVMEGLAGRYNPVPQEAYERIEKELAAVKQAGYVDYFLIVADYVTYARDRDIPVGFGRGAAAGSLLAYALGITDIDPLKYGLLFERFLNPERLVGPDIDTELCYKRRGEVMDYVRRKYGNEHAAGIVTFKRYGPRMAIRDVARLEGLSYSEAESLIRKIPVRPGIDISAAVEESSELKEKVARKSPAGRVLEIAGVLEGLPVQVSSHAAGIALSGRALSAYSPLRKDKKSGWLCSQFTAERLEDMGPVKLDFLGFEVLSLLHMCETKIRERWRQAGRAGSRSPVSNDGSCPNYGNPNPGKGQDEKTLRLLGEGTTTGVFQCESSGMKDLLRKAKPRSIEELAALNALYRPGALEKIPAYIEARRACREQEVCREQKKGGPFHHLPAIERILAPTCGLIIYQEQIMEIAHTAAGWTYGKADIFRSTLAGKDDERTREWKIGFMEDAEKNGYSHVDAADVFEAMREAAPYTALKAHSISYALLSYRLAFLKANYPAEYMSSLLEMHEDNPDRYAWYLDEARRMELAMD